jgi:hypothetical protein
MKKHMLSIRPLLFIFFAFSQFNAISQSLAVNGTGAIANPSAMLDVDVSALAAKKGLLIPRITQAQRSAMNPLSSPAQGLLVYQTDGSEGFYYDTSKTTTAVWVYISAGSGTNWNISGNALTGSASNLPNEWLGSSNNYDLAIKTNNTEWMRVTAAGKVGIHSISPNSELTVLGNIDVTGSRLHVDAATNRIGIATNIPNARLDIYGETTSSATAAMYVKNLAGSTIIYARDDQKVGILTTSPNSELTVLGNIDVTGSRLHVDAATNRIGIATNIPNARLDIYGETTSSATAALYVKNLAGSTIIYARDDQHVGIGSTSPNSTLSVAGSVSYPVSVQGGSYTVAATDYCIIYTGGVGNTFTLPAPGGVTGRVYIFVNHGSATLSTSPAYTFSLGGTTTGVTVSTSVQLISDGTVWRKIN